MRIDGKIRAIIRSGSSAEKNLTFTYDPSGNRLAKKVYSPSGTLMYSNYSIRDGSGNVWQLTNQISTPSQEEAWFTR